LRFRSVRTEHGLAVDLVRAALRSRPGLTFRQNFAILVDSHEGYAMDASFLILCRSIEARLNCLLKRLNNHIC
jgi:hypothetical protein